MQFFRYTLLATVCLASFAAVTPKKPAHTPSKNTKAVVKRPALKTVNTRTVQGKNSKATTRSGSSARKSTFSSRTRSAKRAPVRGWRAGQSAPSPDRYKEIQEALARKGYLHQGPTGTWDQNSADALRRFQQDQNLQPNGKLDSLSIIALGLGPRYEASTEKKPAVSQP
ncbi:MAG: peptidoglycan-binding domain-containing protein [Bryobacteraceae bacterium]